ncbi:ABC transporter permease [Neobacillus sp. D3-1R]|uniref:ABC transporter permease n=1 Tax=Neobacillus sp. D3-1R TaxID=3445778 RepID=UPI003F9F3122
MKSLTIAWKDFKIRIMDRKGFLSMILMPLVLTAILGAALSSVMGGDGGFSETTLGLYQADQDELAQTFRKEVLPELEFVKVKKVDSEEQLQKMLNDGKIDVGLSFPKEWSSDIREGALKEIAIYSQSDKELKATVIQSIIESYSDRVKTLSVSTNTVMNDLAASKASELDMKEVANTVLADIMEAGKQQVSIKEESVGKKLVSSMQYYAAGMAVMFLLFNATMGAKSILQERSTETLARLMMTPTSNGSILIGKFFGTLLFALIQLIIFYTATTLFYGVDWGGNVLQVIAVGMSYAVAVSGLSMILAAIVSEEKTTDVISGIGIQIFAILGGSMLPIYVFPDSLQMVANITPNKWALTSFLEIMSGTSWNALLLPITVLLLMGLVSLMVGTWRLKAR